MALFTGRVDFILCFGCLLITMAVAQAPDEVAKTLQKNKVVPDVISQAPEKLLKVTYGNDLIASNGVELTPTQVKDQPHIEWDAEPNAFYTLIMTDPDAPSREEPKFREFKHWLVGNIPGNSIAEGEVITSYIGSGPPKGTGLHRYVFLLYKQSGRLEFDEPRVGNNSRQGRPKFRAQAFAKKYNLGTPIAGNFYQAQWDEYVPILHRQLSNN